MTYAWFCTCGELHTTNYSEEGKYCSADWLKKSFELAQLSSFQHQNKIKSKRQTRRQIPIPEEPLLKSWKSTRTDSIKLHSPLQMYARPIRNWHLNWKKWWIDDIKKQTVLNDHNRTSRQFIGVLKLLF